jgi:hypothetical protein
VLASDGLLYHETLAEFALEAWIDKLGSRLSSGAGNAKRYGHEHDPGPLYADIREAARLLANLNGKSRSLSKQHVLKAIKGSAPPPAETPDALPVGAPPGCSLGSQGNGIERKGLVIDADSGAGALDRDQRDAMWSLRLAEAHVAGGEGLDLTVPGMHVVRDLRWLCEPPSGEPCTWDEVLDAIRIAAKRAAQRGKPVRSWTWIREDAIAIRDRRLNANLPDPKVTHERAHPDARLAAREADRARSLAGAAAAAGQRWKP